ncbi:MAG: molybdopterin-guanine dinucleotide biosynthesis protein B [Bacillus sp. (in: firmicutes)]
MALVTYQTQPVVFQLAGYSNSGKTTLMTKLISALNSDGKMVATLKHHGHGGKPDLLQNKDSSQHLNAGAIASLVEGEGRILLQAERQSWSIQEQIQILAQLQPDFILIEGHKQEDFPKAVLVRRHEDLELLSNLKNIVVVFYWDMEIIKNDSLLGKNAFHIDDPVGLIWIKEFLYQMKNTKK